MKAIVSLNSGSSSIKFALFTLEAADNPTCLLYTSDAADE